MDTNHGTQYIRGVGKKHYLRNYPEDQWASNTVDMAAAPDKGEEWCIADTGLGYFTIESVVSLAHLKFNNAKTGLSLVSVGSAKSDNNAKIVLYNGCMCPTMDHKYWYSGDDCEMHVINGGMECYDGVGDVRHKFRCQQNGADPNYQAIQYEYDYYLAQSEEYISAETKEHIAMRAHAREDERFCVVETESGGYSLMSGKYPFWWLYGGNQQTKLNDNVWGWETWRIKDHVI